MSATAELDLPHGATRPGSWAGAPPEHLSLIDLYIREQQQLTAVERFAQCHEADEFPLQARYYSSLMPAAPPQAGEQYGFEVDLDACSGCKACVTACSSLNGLDENETWRDVGLLHGGTADLPTMQHVTSACHHCLDPACLNVCPVKAYEKDPATGIVRHLDDQCIGCEYCILACPYDVPKYNKQRGIVRKCDMCSHRLAVNEAPACVQACPNSAIRITVVNRQEVIDNCETGTFLPGAPEPQLTQPTTHYKTNRVLPRNLLPADYYSVKPEHAHWPLVFMLVLTQLSVGAFLIELLLHSYSGGTAARSAGPVQAVGALLFGWLALGASTLHLGRPLYAFRAIIGLKTSWLSREILAFGLFAALATAYAAAVLVRHPAQTPLGVAVVACGFAGLLCSIMIYQCTRRAFWNGTNTTLRFLLTAVVLGTATALLTSIAGAAWSAELTVSQITTEYGMLLCKVLIAATSAKLLFEAALFTHLRDKQNTPLKRSAILMTATLVRATKARFVIGGLGGIVLPGLVMRMADPAAGANSAAIGALVLLLFVATLAGELLERYLFFTAVVAPRMPGGLSP